MTDSEPRPIAWITGAGGLIGNCLVQAAQTLGADWRVRGLTRDQLDLLETTAVAQAFQRERPTLVIHCAALTRSLDCELQPARARRLNVDVTAQLVDLASAATFAFFSTDLIFDGRHGNYGEADAPNPLSVYAETKVVGEQITARHPHHLIIRTSLNGGVSPTGDRGFNEQLRLQWQRDESARLFADEFRSPIAARETARAVWELIGRAGRGVFHVAGSEQLSRLRIGELLAARWPQLQPKIQAGSLKDYAGPPRPADCSLNCTKAESLLGRRLPGMTGWLAAHPEEIF